VDRARPGCHCGIAFGMVRVSVIRAGWGNMARDNQSPDPRCASGLARQETARSRGLDVCRGALIRLDSDRPSVNATVRGHGVGNHKMPSPEINERLWVLSLRVQSRWVSGSNSRRLPVSGRGWIYPGQG